MKVSSSTYTVSILAVLLSLLFIPILTVNGKESDPVSRLRSVARDQNGGLIYILNGDSSLSSYDTLNKVFKSVRGIIDTDRSGYDYVKVSPGGNRIALISVSTTDTAVDVFDTADINTAEGEAKNLTPVRRFSLSRVGASDLTFSTKGEMAYLTSSVDGKLYVLNIDSGNTRGIDLGHGSPLDVYSNPDNTKIFVLNRTSNEVKIVEVMTGSILATVRVGQNPTVMSYDKQTDLLVVANTGNDTVSIIDAKRNLLLRNVSVGKAPSSIAHDSVTKTIFIGNSGDGTVTIIGSDFSAKTLKVSSPAYYNSYPLLIAFSVQQKRLLVLNASVRKYTLFSFENTSRSISEITQGSINGVIKHIEALDGPALFLVASINADALSFISMENGQYTQMPSTPPLTSYFFSYPQSVSIDDESNNIYISNLGSNSITVIDGKNQKPTAVIQLTSVPQVIAVNIKTKKLYVSSPDQDLITIVDLRNSSYPTKVIRVGKTPRSILVDSNHNKVYVSNSGEHSVSVIDGSVDEVTKTIDLSAEGQFPLVATINTQKNEVYVTSYGSDRITVIDGNTNTVQSSIKVGKNPLWVAYEPKSNQIYVTVESDRKIVRINPDTHQVTEEISTGNRIPYRIFLDKETGLVYINHRKDENVTVLLPPTQPAEKSTVLQESLIPYLGQTDTIYNMLGINYKTGLSYVSYGRKNKVIIISTARVGANKILSPGWVATIKEDGQVEYNSESQPLPSGFRRQGLTVLVGGFVILFAFIIWLLNRKPALPKLE